MGWLITGFILILMLTLVARFSSKRRKPGRHRVTDVEIYDRVERECLDSGLRQGEFAIELDDLSDLDWLDLGSHDYSREDFHAAVKWRNQGNHCIYKIVATAGEGEHSITKHSQKHAIPLES
ncbi:MAG: hypothetical protein ACU843_04220 [Gammaproteobacteria bacterium]